MGRHCLTRLWDVSDSPDDIVCFQPLFIMRGVQIKNISHVAFYALYSDQRICLNDEKVVSSSSLIIVSAS